MYMHTFTSTTSKLARIVAKHAEIAVMLHIYMDKNLSLAANTLKYL
jgi:hypothetical protein